MSFPVHIAILQRLVQLRRPERRLSMGQSMGMGMGIGPESDDSDEPMRAQALGAVGCSFSFLQVVAGAENDENRAVVVAHHRRHNDYH